MSSTNALDNFDYNVSCDDFLLYELGRLIEEDRASFEDEEFRTVIESGIHEHIERRLDVRAEMARRIRTSGPRSERLLRPIEDIESPLRDIPPIIQSYTAYLFQRLEQCSEVEPDERITGAADTLLQASGDRAATEAALDFIGTTRNAVCARILAHVVSEPMLDEDLETKAYRYLRAMWSLPRHYILYALKPHTHEDLPFRWFQLLIECGEPSAVDRILEELLVHGGNPEYHEDLLALVALLEQSHDPDTEEKIVQVLNSDRTPGAVTDVLETFLKNTKRTAGHARADAPWLALHRAYAANERYLAAAKLLDAGKKIEAAHALNELLKDDPDYPLAVMLKGLM